MYYPIMLNITNKNILVVGGGEVAYRKSINLLKFGANLKILAPKYNKKFDKLSCEVEFIEDEYNEKYLEKIFIVIGATSSRDINKKIKKDANKRNILVNIVDDKDSCDFITPSIMENEALQIAISSKGKFPTLSKFIRKDLEDRYRKYDIEFIELLEELRELVLEKYFENRKEIFENALMMDKKDLKEYIKKL